MSSPDPKPTEFVVSSMDGAAFDADAMRAWMTEFGIVGAVEPVNKDNRPLLAMYEHVGLRRAYVITIPDPDHAVIWRLRWAEDETVHEDRLREVEEGVGLMAAQIAQLENERILALMLEKASDCMLDATSLTGAINLAKQLGFAR